MTEPIPAETPPEERDRDRDLAVMISVGLAGFGFATVFTAIALLASPVWALLAAGVLALWFSFVASTRSRR